MILRDNRSNVIPGEQRKTRNPGDITTGSCRMLLDAHSPKGSGTGPGRTWDKSLEDLGQATRA